MATTKTYRTKHVGMTIGFLQHLDDAILSQAFNGAPAADARQYLEELRAQGYEVVPCNCGNYDEKGHCKGVSPNAK